VEEVFVFLFEAALLIQGIQLKLRYLLLQQQHWISQAQVDQLHGAIQPYFSLLMVYTVMNKFKSMIDSWVVVGSAEALVNHKLLVVSSDDFVLIVLNFDLIAQLQKLDFVNTAVDQVLRWIGTIDYTYELVVGLNW